MSEKINTSDADNGDLGLTSSINHLPNCNYRAYSGKMPINEHGVSSLSISVASGDIETVRNILDTMHSYDDVRETFVTPFLVAALNGYNAIIRLLYNKWPQEINSACNITGMTPLILAVSGKHYDTVELLLSLGADWCARNKLEKNALDIAAMTNQPEIEQLLLSYRQTSNENIPAIIASPRISSNYSSPVHLRKTRNFLFSPIHDKNNNSKTTRSPLLVRNKLNDDGYSDYSESSYSNTADQVGCFEPSVKNQQEKTQRKIGKIFNIFTKRKVERTKFRKSVARMDMKSLLEKLNLQIYSSYFISNEIDAETFLSLTDSDLEQIGIKKFSDRLKILKRTYKYLNEI